MASDIVKEIKELQGRIEAAGTKKAQLEGRLTTYYDQLKELGFETLVQTREEITKLQQQEVILETRLREGLAALREAIA